MTPQGRPVPASEKAPQGEDIDSPYTALEAFAAPVVVDVITPTPNTFEQISNFNRRFGPDLEEQPRPKDTYFLALNMNEKS